MRGRVALACQKAKQKHDGERSSAPPKEPSRSTRARGVRLPLAVVALGRTRFLIEHSYRTLVRGFRILM
jgi:hypothetical protein